MALSKYQKFKIETINRADIQNAEYNPRIMDKEAKKRLREGLKKHGLVSTLTWNKRTGNLVGGHQRLEQLDALEGSNSYSLDVCVIDVDEAEEAILNVQLNNPSMQGEWDFDRLADMTADFGISFDDMGFTQTDVDFMFDGDERFSDLFEGSEVHETKEKLNKVKEARAASVYDMKERNGINWYSVIVFESEEAKREFYKKINTPIFEEYLTVDKLERLTKE